MTNRQARRLMKSTKMQDYGSDCQREQRDRETTSKIRQTRTRKHMQQQGGIKGLQQRLTDDQIQQTKTKVNNNNQQK